MFADEVVSVLDAILNHTNNNDVKFQAKKLKYKASLQKYRKLSDIEQRDELYNLIQEVKIGYDTMKSLKLKATDMIYSILKDKLGLDEKRAE